MGGLGAAAVTMLVLGFGSESNIKFPNTIKQEQLVFWASVDHWANGCLDVKT